MSRITVVSLGPGPREYLTLGALSALEKAEKLVLRTEKCDTAAYLREKGISFDTLDHLHEEADDFEELAENAAQEVLKAAENAPVCYAVFDAGSDETVRILMQHTTDIVILPGMPLSAPFGVYPLTVYLIPTKLSRINVRNISIFLLPLFR